MRIDCGHELINTECLECWKRRCEHLQSENAQLIDGIHGTKTVKDLESKLEIARGAFKQLHTVASVRDAHILAADALSRMEGM